MLPAPGMKPLLRALALGAVIGLPGCQSPEPQLSFLDDASSLAFVHAPSWRVGSAEQDGVRYRFLTAPKGEGDTEALSVTLIAPTAAASLEAMAEPYLGGATGVVRRPGGPDWSFKDSTGMPSRLWLASLGDGRFFGAWVRGSDAAMARYQSRIDALLSSLHVEDPATWTEERFGGIAARTPRGWTRGSRLSSATSATMLFKSPPLAVEKATATIHGFVTLAKEPVPPPGDLEAFRRALKDRSSDTVAVLEHREWPADEALGRGPGYMDYMRSGTTLTATRIRRWITVRNGVGLVLSCEARVDAFDRLDPWCRRMADTVRLE